jgi:hypothetical protein
VTTVPVIIAFRKVHHFVSGPPVTGYSHQSCWFNVSDVKFLCFITHQTSFSHFTSGRRHRLPPNDKVIIRLDHLLSSTCTTCPHHFNILFSILSKIVFRYPIFSLMTSLLTSLKFFSKNPFLYSPFFL